MVKHHAVHHNTYLFHACLSSEHGGLTPGDDVAVATVDVWVHIGGGSDGKAVVIVTAWVQDGGSCGGTPLTETVP